MFEVPDSGSAVKAGARYDGLTEIFPYLIAATAAVHEGRGPLLIRPPLPICSLWMESIMRSVGFIPNNEENIVAAAKEIVR